MASNNKLCAIIPAAGKSRRFGADKRLAPINGKAMLLDVALQVKEHVDDVLVVLSPGDHKLRDMLCEKNIQSIYCNSSHHGMGNSLACGIAARQAALAWLVVPGDMPAIKQSTYRKIVAEMYNGASICAPYHDGRRGHPVGFNRAFKPHLLALSGHSGARSVINSHSETVTAICVDDPGICMDIDIPTQLQSERHRA